MAKKQGKLKIYSEIIFDSLKYAEKIGILANTT